MIDPYYKGPEYTLVACSNVVAALLGDHHTEVSLYMSGLSVHQFTASAHAKTTNNLTYKKNRLA